MVNTKKIYTLATVNGISHKEVKEYIWKEWGLGTTKDLDEEQYKSLIKYLDKEVITVADKILAMGFFGKAPRAGAPSFVKGSVSIKAEDAIKFINEHKNDAGYVNIDFLENKNDSSKWNAFLNDWKPSNDGKPSGEKKEPEQAVQQKPAHQQPSQVQNNEDDIFQ